MRSKLLALTMTCLVSALLCASAAAQSVPPGWSADPAMTLTVNAPSQVYPGFQFTIKATLWDWDTHKNVSVANNSLDLEIDVDASLYAAGVSGVPEEDVPPGTYIVDFNGTATNTTGSYSGFVTGFDTGTALVDLTQQKPFTILVSL